MSPDVAERRQQLQQAAVRLINHPRAPLTLTDVCAEAGMDGNEFHDSFDSVDELIATVHTALVKTHVQSMTATFARRRSLTESLQLAFSSYWDNVEVHLEMQLAVRQLLTTGLSSTEAARDRYSQIVAAGEKLLLDLGSIHQIAWKLPVTQLAKMIIAMLGGLLIDYMNTRDSATVRQILDVFAYHLAQHGRRSVRTSRCRPTGTI